MLMQAFLQVGWTEAKPDFFFFCAASSAQGYKH